MGALHGRRRRGSVLSGIIENALPILYVVALATAWIGAGIVTLLKGRKAAFFVGLVLAGVVWLVAAFLPARPGSWWRRHVGPRDARS